MRSITSLLLVGVAFVTLSACGGSRPVAQGKGGQQVKLTLVAYSTPKEAYEEIIPAFQKTEAGKNVEFETSYGSSGEQSRAVESGLPADVVAFSLEPDISRLVKAGLVKEGWDGDQYKGMVTDSVVVLAVRKGNPKHVRTWDDLTSPDVEVLTPNPFTSGGARWNVMAAYGAQLEQGKSSEQAVEYLSKLFDHVTVQDKSAREALQTFAGGKGDVMLAYENEVITAQQKGEELGYIIPHQTILIENPVAVTSDSQYPKEAQAFVDFLRSPEAQRIFGKRGYRPIVKDVQGEFKYPRPSGLFDITRVGGWSEVKQKFFDPETGIMAKINREREESVDSR